MWRQPDFVFGARPGFEPRTSRTLCENHTPRPTSHIKQSFSNFQSRKCSSDLSLRGFQDLPRPDRFKCKSTAENKVFSFWIKLERVYWLHCLLPILYFVREQNSLVSTIWVDLTLVPTSNLECGENHNPRPTSYVK